MLEAEVNNERTILDYLNEDCWRAVLQYVGVQDLIRTERASRRWQQAVLTYLQTIHIMIEETETAQLNACWLELSESTTKSFESWTKKLGTSVVAAYCNSLGSLAIIKENCPNMEALKLVSVETCAPDEVLPHNLHENFMFMKRVAFYDCHISDSCISQFLADKALEELEFQSCHYVSGLCFNSMNLSNLKTLMISLCERLEPKHMLRVFHRLGELTKLKLDHVPHKILEEIQPVLDKMPKLEWLELYDPFGISCLSSEPLSRLTRLKHLRVSYQLDDKDMEAVTRSCQDLLTLDFTDCRAMMPSSLESVCRHAGARLAHLRLGTFYDADDDDVVTLIRGCPRLKSLTVAGSGALTPSLPARAAAARSAVSPGRRLRLDLSDTNLADDDYLLEVKDEYEEMRTEFEDLTVVLL